MNGRNIIIWVTALVLVFLLVFPSIYIQAACTDYLRSLNKIENAVINRDANLAQRLIDQKLANWDEENTLILAFTPHAETESIKASIVKLSHSIRQKQFELAQERTEILYVQIRHLIDGSRLSWENIF